MKRRLELERQCELEQKWEQGNPVGLRESEQNDLHDPKLGSATRAFEHLDSMFNDGELGKAGPHAVGFHRKRARDMEATTKLRYPRDLSKPYPASENEGSSMIMTVQQRGFADAYIMRQGDPPEYGPEWASPLKRRKLDSSVRVALDSRTYVRKEADINLLFPPSASLTADFLEDATSESVTNGPDEDSRHMNPLTKKPYDVQNLKTEDGETAKIGCWRSIPEPRYERIDTSGCSKRVAEWNEYRRALREEAGEPNPDPPKKDPDYDTVEDYGLTDRFLGLGGPEGHGRTDPDDLDAEMPTETEVARTNWGIQQMEIRQQAQRVERHAHKLLAELEEWTAQSTDAIQGRRNRRRRQDRSPSSAAEEVHAPLYAEMAAQRYREAVSFATDAPQGEFWRHGGMASAFALSSFVGGAAVELLHRHGVS